MCWKGVLWENVSREGVWCVCVGKVCGVCVGKVCGVCVGKVCWCMCGEGVYCVGKQKMCAEKSEKSREGVWCVWGRCVVCVGGNVVHVYHICSLSLFAFT